MVPAAAFFLIQDPSLAVDTIGSHVWSGRKSLGLTCSIVHRFHLALLPPAHSWTQRLRRWMLLLHPGVGVGAVDTKGWRGNKAMQRHLSHCRRTRSWVIVHHNHCYSKETKAGRAALVLDVFSPGGKKQWKMFKVIFCLNLTWLCDDERGKNPKTS